MKVIRSFAASSNSIDMQRILQQIIELELEKIVNNKSVNSPASHKKITHGGDYE